VAPKPVLPVVPKAGAPVDPKPPVAPNPVADGVEPNPP
jgi:hypothetical protein